MRVKDLKNIGIFRALQLGDMLCAIPAIRALRHACPGARITLIGLPWAASLPGRFPHYFDDFICFPGYEGLPEQEPATSAYPSFLEEVRRREFDLLLQMQGNGSIVNELLADFGAKKMAGYFKDHPPAGQEYFIRYPDHGYEAERHLLLMRKLGITARDARLEFPLLEKDFQELQQLHLPVEKKKYLCIHPGSRDMKRQWHPKYFAAIADHYLHEGWPVIITGTQDERYIALEMIKYMKGIPINMTGRTSLGAVALLIRDALGLVCNCTGVSHIAAAMRTPSVVISMDGEPMRWAPQNKTLHRVTDCSLHPRFNEVFEKAVALTAHEKNTLPKREMAF